MKITHNKIGQNINTSDAKSTDKSSSASKTAGVNKSSNTSDVTDASEAQSGAQATKVELSQRVKDIKRIQELAKSAPDVDTEKVAKFRQMIADGTYKVDSKAIADKMVDEALKAADSE